MAAMAETKTGRAPGAAQGGRWRGALGLLLCAALQAGCVGLAEHRKLAYEVDRLRSGGVGSSGAAAELRADIEALREKVARLEGRVEMSEHNSENALREAQSARQAMQGGAPAAAPKAAQGGRPSRELRAYREAYDAWLQDEHKKCIDRFSKFLRKYPNSPYGDDASYWFADCHYKRGDFQNAVLRFDDVVNRYPRSDRAPEALFRQGEALLELGHGSAAQRAFQRVRDEYPESEHARSAAQQLDLLGSG